MWLCLCNQDVFYRFLTINSMTTCHDILHVPSLDTCPWTTKKKSAVQAFLGPKKKSYFSKNKIIDFSKAYHRYCMIKAGFGSLLLAMTRLYAETLALRVPEVTKGWIFLNFIKILENKGIAPQSYLFKFVKFRNQHKNNVKLVFRRAKLTKRSQKFQVEKRKDSSDPSYCLGRLQHCALRRNQEQCGLCWRCHQDPYFKSASHPAVQHHDSLTGA